MNTPTGGRAEKAAQAVSHIRLKEFFMVYLAFCKPVVVSCDNAGKSISVDGGFVLRINGVPAVCVVWRAVTSAMTAVGKVVSICATNSLVDNACRVGWKRGNGMGGDV